MVNPPIAPVELARIAHRLAALRLEHRDLDVAIKRLKKRKLQLKDQITRLESDLIPDEPA